MQPRDGPIPGLEGTKIRVVLLVHKPKFLFFLLDQAFSLGLKNKIILPGFVPDAT